MKRGKLLFGMLALIMVGSGLGLYIFSSYFGIEPATAKLIAIAFLVTGTIDYAILHFWDWIFNRFE